MRMRMETISIHGVHGILVLFYFDPDGIFWAVNVTNESHGRKVGMPWNFRWGGLVNWWCRPVVLIGKYFYFDPPFET